MTSTEKILEGGGALGTTAWSHQNVVGAVESVMSWACSSPSKPHPVPHQTMVIPMAHGALWTGQATLPAYGLSCSSFSHLLPMAASSPSPRASVLGSALSP